jgi:RING finger/CHY zinc finger protein 1
MPWKQVETIVCGRCQKKQPKSNKCINSKCGIKFGDYYCDKCCVWTFNKQPIFHCDDCNTCHQAEKSKIKHCSTCKNCIDKRIYNEHVSKCKEDNLKNNCAICLEDLKRGTTSATIMPCGHIFHIGCVQEYTAKKVKEMEQGKLLSVNCPLCAKSMLRREDKETEIHLENVRRLLDTIPVFEEKLVTIYCNECEKIIPNQRFHHIGIECPDCKMFNTRVVNYKLNFD